MPALIIAFILLFSLFTARDVYFAKNTLYERQEERQTIRLQDERQERVAEVFGPAPEVKKEEVKREDESVRKKVEAERREELRKLSEEVASLQKSIASISKPPPPPSSQPSIKSEEIYRTAESALMNIFCDDEVKNVYILGSGAIIHPAGYVLTNAHIAEHFGKEKEGIECVLRRGSPALHFARARIAFLPDQSEKISSTQISRNDIAILKITSLVDGSALPSEFAHFTLDPAYQVKEGETLYSLGYPTEFLKSQAILTNTTILFSLGVVEDMVSADDDLSDPEGAYLKGEVSAQHGSSGGLFLEAKEGKIAGLFVGLTEGQTTAERKQFMFLASYIDEVVRREAGAGLAEFLANNP